jgi:hypothetical protein
MASLDFLNNEFRNMVVPIANEWDAGNNEADDVQYPIFMGNVFNGADPTPYPGIIFHRQKTPYQTESSSVAHPVEEVAIFVAPSELGYSLDPYLSIYRVTNDEWDEELQVFTDSLFSSAADGNEIPTTRYNSRTAICEKVIGMQLLGVYFSNIDTDFLSTELLYPLESHTLESFQVLLTIAPPATQISLRNSTVDPLDYDTPAEHTNLIGDNQDISNFVTEKGFYFQNLGFFANFATGQVFRYTRSESNSSRISIQKVLDDACTDLEDGLVTGFTFQRHFSIR